MEEQGIEGMNQTQQHPWLVNNILFYYEREKHMGMTAREGSTSYNTKEITVKTRKTTLTDQRQQERK